MIITSEQVGKGHPDKICDQISDLVLTEVLSKDKDARVAVESAIGKKILFITGEITTKTKNYSKTLEAKIMKLLTSIDKDYKEFKIIWNVAEQSREIASKVNNDGKDLGAGDQGMMFGYATNETPTRLPIPYYLASQIILEYEKRFASKSKSKYKFDSKSQVSYDYSNKKIVNINLSVQHSADLDLKTLRNDLKVMILDVVSEYEKNLPKKILTKDTEIVVNNAGTFIEGGALADAGLTGRKIIADTYGGFGRHGGGAFSGKDYTKVDRSGAYYARYVARKIVDAKLADICEVQVAYIIGRSEPVAINIETFETEKKSMKEIEKWVNKNFDFRLSNIIEELKLKKIDYTKTTLYGHFGKSYLPWK